jgi:hypothetical protein
MGNGKTSDYVSHTLPNLRDSQHTRIRSAPDQYRYANTDIAVRARDPSKYNLNSFCLCLLPPKSRWLGGRHNADRSVLPRAAKEEEIKLGSANGEPQLRLLGVDVLRKQTIDLSNHVLRVRESDWPPELRPRTGLLLLRLTEVSIRRRQSWDPLK